MAVNHSFDHNHYVPVVRPKAAEMSALCKLLEEDAKHVTPLIEFFPEMSKKSGQQEFDKANSLDYFFKFACRIGEHWDRNPFFFDLELIEKEFTIDPSSHSILFFFNEAKRLGLRGIPVTGLVRTPTYQDAVAKIVKGDVHEVCIRLNESDLSNPLLKVEIVRLLQRLGLSPSNTHLVVDLKLIHNHSPRINIICESLPLLFDWRTFTIVAGSFPTDLVKLKKNAQHELPRLEYVRWSEFATSSRRRLRIPTFGDYTVQHPFFKEMPKAPNVSASIRYASDLHWVIMRGEWLGTPGGTGSQQYLGHAILLMERDEYSGKDYSYADQYIWKKVQAMSNPGGPRDWIEVGINRHVTHTSRMVLETFRSVDIGGVMNRRKERLLPSFWPEKKVSLAKARYQNFLFNFDE